MSASSSSINNWGLHNHREATVRAEIAPTARVTDISRHLPQGCAPARKPDAEAASSVAEFRIPRWKRGFDLTLVFLTLPIWLPLMVLISLMIKIVSKGPVLFRQQRIGVGGVPFMMLKFRSMKVNTETHCHEEHLDRLIKSNRPMTKLDATGDSRVIPGGKWFRATALDELPQLLNVIRGEMALVGPRPCTPHEFDRYQPQQKIDRTKLLPGLTGYWQVHGKNRTTFSEMIAMDIYYGQEMSLVLDVAIVAKTFPVLLEQVLEARMRKRNARRNQAPEEISEARAIQQTI